MDSFAPKIGDKKKKRDFSSFLLTVNTQKDWYSLKDDDRDIFGQWFMHMFGKDRMDWFQENFMFRVPFENRKAQVHLATEDTGIEFFSWTGQTEIGEERNRLHCHISMQVVSRRDPDSTVMINTDLIRNVFYEIFGYKCYVNSRRTHNSQLRMEWYARK